VRTPNLKICEDDDLFAIVILFISEVVELAFSSVCIRNIATSNVFVISNHYSFKLYLRLWKGNHVFFLCSHLQHVRKAIDRHPSSKLTKNYVEFEGSVKCIA